MAGSIRRLEPMMAASRRIGAGVAVALGVLALAVPAIAQLGPTGTRAYGLARSAQDSSSDAQAEGEATRKEIQEAVKGNRTTESLASIQEQADGALQALVSYRRQALTAADEAFKLLTEAGRATPSDTIRREVIEEKALLAAHEASVMAARARAEAERLRALAAEGRALLAAAPPAPPPAPPPPAPGREVEVPNLVGARLDAATRDLAALGLKLGATTGPRDGFVVKQVPAAGARVPRQAAVSVTLSTSAAGVTTPAPR
jgi:PASTA domain-containing protein